MTLPPPRPPWPVRPCQPTDAPWLRPLFFDAIFGGNPGYAWARYRRGQAAAGEHFIGIAPHGFAHYSVRRDGVRVLHALAVAPAMRRQGIARALLGAIGCPCTLRTDADNVEANAFYPALGFVLAARLTTRKGKVQHVYCR